MNRLFKLRLSDNRIAVDYDYNLGHTWGQGQRSSDRKHNFIHIPKNASSEIKQTLSDWTQSNYHDIKDQIEHIVILRDPTDRWISGIAEFLVGDFSHTGNSQLSLGEIEGAINTKMFQNLLFDFVIFDGHTIPQCCYLEGLDVNDITFFYFNDSVVPRILNYVGEPRRGPNHANNSLTNSKKQVIIKKIKSLLTDRPDLQHKIDVHYYADHQLFDRVTFHVE